MTGLGFRVMRDYNSNILKAPIFAPRIVPSMHFFVPYQAPGRLPSKVRIAGNPKHHNLCSL